MSDNGNQFVMEMLCSIRSEIGDLRKGQIDIELRLTASEHLTEGLMVHIASTDSGINELKADMRLVKRRLDLVDA